MMYKGIGFDIHHHIRAIPTDVNVHDVTPRRTGLTLHRTKRRKIILSNQTLRRTLHTFCIQRFIKMRHALA
ncbi:Uncharacterised protein [Enterobacter cloacae]|nr:Uncharacterised protein [Enterobacter cloacae]